MTRERWARAWYAVTFLVALGAIVLQFALVWRGHLHLGDTEAAIEVAGRPDRATRVVRFFSYLTIWGNVIGAVAASGLAVRPRMDAKAWRAIRLDAVVLLFVVGVVHFFFLRPLLHLRGADLLADRLLHIVVPLLAVLGWLVFGLQSRIAAADIGRSLVLPVAWLAYTLIRGAVVDWSPYPFIDVNAHGYAYVAGVCCAVAALLLLAAAAVKFVDPRLPRTG